MSIFDKIVGRKKIYERPSPDNSYNALLELEKSLPDNVILECDIPLDRLKSVEKQLPTNWMYKKIYDPLQFSIRHISLRSSMLGEYDNTIKICSDGLLQFPDDPYLLYMLGRTFSDMGRVTGEEGHINKAIDTLDNTIKLFPNFPDAYFERGKCKLFLNQLDNAEQGFSRAIEFESDDQSIIAFKEYLDHVKYLKAENM